MRAFSLLVVSAVLGLFAFGSFLPRAAAQGEEAKKAALKDLLTKAEDEYRLFFHKPKTPFEFWAAIDFELKTGKFDVAGLLLDQMMKLQPKEKTDEKLLEIEELQGMSVFLKLNTVKMWNANADLQKEAEQNVKELINRVTAGLEQKLTDPVRIKKLIDQLSAPTLPERSWAFKQLKRTKHRAAPFLVEEFIKSTDKKTKQRIHEALLILDSDILLPLIEILKPADEVDYKDESLRLAILDVFGQRDEKAAIPYLWHMSASPKFPAGLRAKAKQTLAALLGTAEDKLADPRQALTQLAEKYYHHQVKFRHVLYDPKSEAQFIKFWAWNKNQVLDKKHNEMAIGEAEVLFAMRHVKEALDLDPNYKPAQKLFLTMILDQTFSKNLDQFLLKPMPPDIHKLLVSLDAGLLMDVLQQAINESNLPVILPLIHVLGERGEIKAALPSPGGTAQGLVKALYYPDQRVQLAALRAIINLPGEQPSPVKARVIELLQQFLLTEQVSRVLVLNTPEGQEMLFRDAIKKMGFEGVLAADRKDAFTKLHQTADYDYILIHPSFPAKDLPFLLSELRADSSAGLLPVMLLANLKTNVQMQVIAAKHRNVFVVLDGLLATPPALKKEMEDAYKLSKAPTFIKDASESQKYRVLEEILNSKGAMLSPAERKQLSLEAMEVLWGMGNGTIKGYSLHPAKAALMAAAQSKELAVKAIDTLGSLPSADVQQKLAALTLDNALDKNLRFMAAFKLHQHILKHSLALPKHQIAALRAAANATPEPELRKQLLLVVSSLPGTTTPKLSEFTPAPPK